MLQQRTRNLVPCGIAIGVQHAIAAMRSFTGEQQTSVLAIEIRAPRKQLFNGMRRLGNQYVDRLAVAQTITGEQRILFV